MMATLKPRAPQITHVVFDMDGLLLDTEKFYTVVQERILAEYGKRFDWSLKAKMMGKKALEAGEIFVQDTGLSGILTPEEFIKRRESMLHAMFPDSDLMPGAERLIHYLHANSVPMAVATSSHRRHFELKTTKHGPLFELMHHIVTGDDPDVAQGKPSPDIFLVAANRFKDLDLKVANVLVFEDAPSGVAAAHAAGICDKLFEQSGTQGVLVLLDHPVAISGLASTSLSTSELLGFPTQNGLLLCSSCARDLKYFLNLGGTRFGYRPVVMVPDSNLASGLCQEADQVLTSLAEFDPTHWGLPRFPMSVSA